MHLLVDTLLHQRFLSHPSDKLIILHPVLLWIKPIFQFLHDIQNLLVNSFVDLQRLATSRRCHMTDITAVEAAKFLVKF